MQRVLRSGEKSDTVLAENNWCPSIPPQSKSSFRARASLTYSFFILGQRCAVDVRPRTNPVTNFARGVRRWGTRLRCIVGQILQMQRRSVCNGATHGQAGTGCLRFSTCAAGITSPVIALSRRHPIYPHDFSQFMLDDLLRRLDCWGSSSRSNILHFHFRLKGKGCIMQGVLWVITSPSGIGTRQEFYSQLPRKLHEYDGGCLEDLPEAWAKESCAFQLQLPAHYLRLRRTWKHPYSKTASTGKEGDAYSYFWRACSDDQKYTYERRFRKLESKVFRGLILPRLIAYLHSRGFCKWHRRSFFQQTKKRHAIKNRQRR